MAKKTFKDNLTDSFNPAETFITSTADTTALRTAAVKKQPKQETKSERVNLLFKPSIKTGLEKIAFVNKTSLNDLVNTIAKDYIDAHGTEIEKYNTFFEE